MNIDSQALAGLQMWTSWQNKVKASLPMFCANPIYVEQLSPSKQEFARIGAEVFGNPIEPEAALRDVEFGGVAHKFRVGPEIKSATRMWLDANIEIRFIEQHCPVEKPRVLEIGAGYGRLAALYQPLCARYVTTDAVPISTQLCRFYCGRYAPDVEVWNLAELAVNAQPDMFDLAVNIHSWNECSVEQIRQWLDVLVGLRVPWLFAVSHGKGAGAWKTQEHGQPSWRHLLTERYELVHEAEIGLGPHPHTIWRLKCLT